MRRPTGWQGHDRVFVPHLAPALPVFRQGGCGQPATSQLNDASFMNTAPSHNQLIEANFSVKLSNPCVLQERRALSL